MYKSIFHERLSTALRARNMRQIELAERTGLNKSQINEYVSGKCRPKQDKLYLIAVALNVSPMWLMGFDVPMDKNATNLKQQVISKINSFFIVKRYFSFYGISSLIRKFWNFYLNTTSSRGFIIKNSINQNSFCFHLFIRKT